jgi:two-component system, NtrC family, response regulator AtoC
VVPDDPSHLTRDSRRVTDAPPRDVSAGVSLLVMSKAGVYTIALPEAGELTVGRGDDCDIRLNDAKVSRLHAVLRVGPTFALVDQGSTNGTVVAGRKLESKETVDLAVGDMVTVGSSVLVLQAAPKNNPPVRVWSKDAFAAMVDQVRERAALDRTTFGIVQIRMDSMPVLDASVSTKTKVVDDVARAQSLDRVLREGLRSSDVVATVGPGRYEALLPNTEPEVGVRIAEQLGATLREEGFGCEVGFASYPKNGLTLEELDAHAECHLHQSADRPPLDATIDRGAMKRLEPVIGRVAAGTINVLILGETGVGKEVLARMIHQRSPRANQPCVTLNCAAVSETLLESELFGHEKGAFTGAAQAKPGLLEAANGGSVFLDEIGEMPMSLQAKLLRVLEQREVLRVGAVKPRQIDVRFISATNRDLEEEIRQGRFRRDLFFRLNGIALTLPPLRERTDEIEPLAKMFIAMVSQQMNRPPPRLSPQVLELLVHYAWPGNIRELRNMMERAVLLCVGDTIGLEHLPETKARGPVVALGAQPAFDPDAMTFSSARASSPSVAGATSPPASPSGGSLRSADDEDERRRIIAALEQCAGNQTKAAQLLGISRRTLVTRLKEYSLPRPRKPL